MKDQYKAVMIFRDGKKIFCTDKDGKKYFNTIERAKEAIQENIKNNKLQQKAGSLIIEVQEEKGEQPYDIVEYKIYKRQVTPWEEV